MGWMGRFAQFATLGLYQPAPTPAARREVEKRLTDEIGTGYKPTLAGQLFWDATSQNPNLARMLQDTEAMLAHPRVASAMGYYKGGCAIAEIELEDASSPEHGAFLLSEAKRFWQRGREPAQRSYEYGRGCCEAVYSRDEGPLRLERLQPFLGLDCRAMTRDGEMVGVRVKGLNATDKSEGDVLPAACGPRPTKAFWMGHNLRYSRWYGLPQQYAAWRPWRRLAGKDGAEDIVDGGVYRFAFQPPLGRYPGESNTPNANWQGPQPAGGVKVSARDKMDELLTSLKAGGTVSLSSRRDESGQYVWDVQWPQGSLDVSGLMAYTDDLEKAISLGVGVPPELLEASEVGSGYSGRAIPLEAFYIGQQGNAEFMLLAWYLQIGLPLLRWNYGPQAWGRLKVADLLQTRMKRVQGSGPQKPPEQPGHPPQQQPGRPQPGQQPQRDQDGERKPPTQLSTFDESKIERADDGRFGEKPGEHAEAAPKTVKQQARAERRAAYETARKAHGERQATREGRRKTVAATVEALAANAQTAQELSHAAVKLPDGDAPDALPARELWGMKATEAIDAASRSAAALERAGASPTTAAKVAAGVVKAATKAKRLAEKHSDLLSRAKAAQEAVRALDPGPEPQSPDHPDHSPEELAIQAEIDALPEDSPELDALNAKLTKAEQAYEKRKETLDKLHEKASDAWDKAVEKKEKAEEKASDLLEKADDVRTDLESALDDISSEQTDLTEAGDGLSQAIDAEEDSDAEPEEPEEDDEDEGAMFGTLRQEGEEWMTNGRAYKRQGGTTVRVPTKDEKPAAATGGAAAAGPGPGPRKHPPEALAARVQAARKSSTPDERAALVADLVSSLTAAQIDALRGEKGGKTKSDKARRLVDAALAAASVIDLDELENLEPQALPAPGAEKPKSMEFDRAAASRLRDAARKLRLRPEEMAGLQAYTSAGWKAGGVNDVAINRLDRDPTALDGQARRAGRDPAEFRADVGKAAAAIDAVLARAVLPEPVAAYRGIAIPPADHAAFLERAKQAAATGGSIRMEGFQSTSLDPKVAYSFGSRTAGDVPLMFRIEARRGAYLEGNGGKKGEHELLLPRGGSYAVKGVSEGPGGRKVIELEQLP